MSYFLFLCKHAKKELYFENFPFLISLPLFYVSTTTLRDDTRGTSGSWSEIFSILQMRFWSRTDNRICMLKCRAFYIKMEKKKKNIPIFQNAFYFGRIDTVWLDHGNLIFLFFPLYSFLEYAYSIEKCKKHFGPTLFLYMLLLEHIL